MFVGLGFEGRELRLGKGVWCLGLGWMKGGVLMMVWDVDIEWMGL